MSPVPATRGNQFKNSSWLALAPFAAVAFGLAFWGFGHHCTGNPCTFPTALEQIGQSVNLVRGRGSFTFGKDPWQLVLAQWLVPLAAILLTPREWRVIVTVVVTVALLAVAGAAAARMGRSGIWRGALRVTVGGAIAMAVTWAVGRMLGVDVG